MMLGDLFNPLWWFLIAPTILLTIWAQWKVKHSFNKWAGVRCRSGITGREAAAAVLRAAEVEGVSIERSHGMLTDHYNPWKKTLALSEPVHDSDSIAALGVAAHEAGHAIQHKGSYFPLVVRSAWVPMAQVGSTLAPILLIIGTVMGGFAGSPAGQTTLGQWVVIGSIYAFVAIALFTLVTLPVEFNASARAVVILRESGIVSSEEEEKGVREILNAAAMTYVAAAAAAVMQVIYLILRYSSSRSRD